MNKYTELSDFEINLAVAHIVLGKGSYDWCPNKKEVYFAGIDGGEFLHHGYFDPCNNPADAMPIVFENGISLISDWNEVGVWGATNQPWYSSENKNPLRAAMEVFLMMRDAERETNT
ncbi:phage protein NinX family protein [Proteus mirabilis]|uniref:phage protein NinX family protein n=1 Tax=Proteus mirabilis TaxID=584 RepID=UPI0029C060C3|nr:phage protein NinX family protein [Proteus mirabilis]MDX4949394.1 phage protein NinX family protein [Proteus mirabilis]